MSLQILGYTKDCRTQTNVVYAEINIVDYLNLVGEDFDRFEIQRKRVDPKKYTRLKEDIRKGALLPGITLAIDHLKVDDFIPLVDKRKSAELIKKLLGFEDIYILDGLQRSYIIKDIKDEGFQFKSDQKLLLEIWFEKEISHLIYRLIVLNSGQRPMSMRHQVELLFMTMKNELQNRITGLEIYSEKDATVRNHAKKFSFDRLVNAYYSFLTKSPEIERENLVVKKLNENEIMSSEENVLNDAFNDFVDYLNIYTQLDVVFYEYYSTKNSNLNGFKNWLSDENTLKSFFAAVGKISSDDRKKERIEISMNKIIEVIKSSVDNVDPFDMEIFNQVKGGIDPKRVNVGIGTRKLIMDGFREFINSEGDDKLEDCWKSAAI